MSAGTKIQWADDTANFWRGCTKVSEGCKNCYAERNIGVKLNGIQWGRGAARVRSKTVFKEVLRWNRQPWVCDACGEASDGLAANQCHCGVKFHRRRVFSLSLGDWLDDEVPVEWLADMLAVIRACPNLDFLLLTKRPENFRKRMRAVVIHGDQNGNESEAILADQFSRELALPPSNIWFGFSAENQWAFDQRWAVARDIPCAQLFVSFEPLLGPITLPADFFMHEPWGIWGGESGPDARACNVEAIRFGLRQFAERECPVFVKQLGGNVWHNVETQEGEQLDPLPLRDKKGGDPAEWPSDLRVRQFPIPHSAFRTSP